MITVTELTPPLKISGLTSFAITFPYNPEIVNLMKSLSFYYYHKAKKGVSDVPFWEIPVTQLTKFLDQAVYLDDIDLVLSRNLPDFKFENNQFVEKSEIREISNLQDLTNAEISAFKVEPFKHQIEGINFGLNYHKWLLLDNPGCGKTNQVIWLAETLKNRGLIDHCLVVAGINSLKSNWKKEINKFSNEQAVIIGEKFKKDKTTAKTSASIAERVKQLMTPISEFFVIINVESLRDDEIIKAIQSGPNNFGMIAIDEVHKCLATGKSSTQGQNLLKLDAPYKVALSGTLIVNDPINCWGPLSWTANDHSTLTNFRSQYCKFGGFNNKQIIGYKDLHVLKDELDSCSLRRTKECLVDLPPKIITYELLDMDTAQSNFYEAIKQGVKEEADKIELNSGNLLALTTRLRQATICPELLTTQNIISVKVSRAVEMAEDLVKLGEKVVILSFFKQPVYQLAQLLDQYKPLVCTGDQSDSEVSANVDKFQEDNDSMILLGTLGKVATGLTLNRASYMILLDEFWTSALNNQAHDRIYRLNNTTPAFITILACKNTIDERVHEVAQFKQELSDFVIDDKPTERFLAILKDAIVNC